MTGRFQDTARRVIRTEAEALMLLEAGLNDDFDRAVDLLLAATGRVIVSGMGKSGHIARKISATFASTGRSTNKVKVTYKVLSEKTEIQILWLFTLQSTQFLAGTETQGRLRLGDFTYTHLLPHTHLLTHTHLLS